MEAVVPSAEKIADNHANEPVNWWLAWAVIGLSTFAGITVAWLFKLIHKQSRQIEEAHKSEVTLASAGGTLGVTLSNIEKKVDKAQEFLEDLRDKVNQLVEAWRK